MEEGEDLISNSPKESKSPGRLTLNIRVGQVIISRIENGSQSEGGGRRPGATVSLLHIGGVVLRLPKRRPPLPIEL